MQTIIQAPIPCRSMDWDTYYFVENKDNLKTKVAYLSNTYKVIHNEKNIVLIFDQDTNEILWLDAERFFANYTVIGKVNQMIFK